MGRHFVQRSAPQYGQTSPDLTSSAPSAPAPVTATTTGPASAAAVPLDLTDFKRDLSELTDRLGQAQDCL